MLQIRFLIAFLLTSLVSSMSIAQTPVAEPSVSVLVSPKSVAGETVTELIEGTDQSPVVPETAVKSVSPAPSISSFDTKNQLGNQVSKSSAVVRPVSYPSNKQVYSPQRDGLPTLEQRRQLRAMPIEQRPNRPFHFYGNTVRRRLGR